MADIALFMNLIVRQLGSTDDTLPHAEALSSAEIPQLLELAKKHDLVPIISSGVLEEHYDLLPETREFLEEALCMSVCHYELMNWELLWIQKLLENEQIPYLPLKGAAIRHYYPEPWLRTSGDIDILIPEEMLDKAIAVLSENGCTPRDRRYHDVPIKTPNNTLLELHFNVREDIENLDFVLDRIWDYCEPTAENSYQLQLSKEFLLFHLVAHMSYHLIHGGCGIRSFVDIWLFRQKETWDPDHLQALLSAGHLQVFYDNIIALIDVWFCGKPHTDATMLLQKLVIDGGTFGSRKAEIIIEQAKSGSKAKYMLHRIFMPYHLLIKQYPVLERCPLLLPCCHFLRWIKILTRNRNNALHEIRTARSQSSDQINNTQKALKQIGLDFKL